MKPRLRYDAVHRLDKIVRAVRTEVEETAKRFAVEEGREEVVQDDIEKAAIVCFESSHEPFMK